MKDPDRRIRGPHELPRSLEPPRDLWPQIEARLQARPGDASAGGRRAIRALPWGFAAAAALAVTAIGLATGLWWMHGGSAGMAEHAGAHAALTTRLAPASPATLPVVAQDDAAARAALLRSLDARLRALPPPTQQKVRADLRLIEQSIQDIQAALGRDPGNALLHEMLRETEQDERHLAATVQQAGVWTAEASGFRRRVGS